MWQNTTIHVANPSPPFSTFPLIPSILLFVESADWSVCGLNFFVRAGHLYLEKKRPDVCKHGRVWYVHWQHSQRFVDALYTAYVASKACFLISIKVYTQWTNTSKLVRRHESHMVCYETLVGTCCSCTWVGHQSKCANNGPMLLSLKFMHRGKPHDMFWGTAGTCVWACCKWDQCTFGVVHI